MLEIVQSLAARPLPNSNATAAAVFRIIETHRPTFLIDEADTFLRTRHGENEELRGILSSGHTRNAAFVRRCDGESSEPRTFSTSAPVAIAMNGELPATLEDRSVTVRMQRKSPGQRVERVRGSIGFARS